MNDSGLGEVIVNLCVIIGNLRRKSGAGETCIQINEHDTSRKGSAARILLKCM
jgi:hypothetical protein